MAGNIEVLLAGGKEGYETGRTSIGSYAALTVGNNEHFSEDRKPVNQDGILIATKGPYTILAVADGVSGAKNSHLGSQHVLEGLAAFNFGTVAPHELDEAVSNELVRLDSTMIKGAATTVLMTILWNAGERIGQMKVYNIGDGMAYLQNDKYVASPLTQPGQGRYNLPFQMDGGLRDRHEHPTEFMRKINYFNVAESLPAGIRLKGNPMMFFQMENTFGFANGSNIIITTDGLRRIFEEDVTRYLAKRNPAQCVKDLVSFAKLNPESVAAGKPNTRQFNDDIGVIAFTVGL